MNRNFTLPKKPLKKQVQFNSQPQIIMARQTEQSELSKYIVLFRPLISLDSLSLKGATFLNKLNVEFLITGSIDDISLSINEDMLKNHISGFIYYSHPDEFEQKIISTIRTLSDVLGIKEQELKYSVNSCQTKILSDILGLQQPVVPQVQTVPLTKQSISRPVTQINTQPLQRLVKRDDSSNPEQAKKANLRRKYNF